MCDTMVLEKDGKSVFGKNSDRDPGELQVLEYCTGTPEEILNNPCPEKLPKYLDGPYKNLAGHAGKWPGTIPALISRPAWMWGAEMGVNIHGLAIGNEAVFSKEKTCPGGLLGMDILRLALHNCTSAAEALGFITGIIGEIGQGGNGSYTGKLEYHNSFLIKDPVEAYVLETSGRHWVFRRVSGFASISNAYTITDNFDGADEETDAGFKGKGENGLFTRVAQGRKRQAFTATRLAEVQPEARDIMAILRSHAGGDAKIRKHMGSVCMHARGIVSSETTASMIVEYAGGGFTVWVTGSPYPCVSLYKPLILQGLEDTPFSSPETALRYAEEAAGFSKRMLALDRTARAEIRRRAEKYEKGFEDMLRGTEDQAAACAAAWVQEKEFRHKAAG